MSPGFAVGGVVVAQRVPVSSLAERDVIIFHKPTDPNAYVVHRIVSLTTKGGATVIETKGDNNAVKDPWTVSLRGDVAYRATFTIPFVGYAALWLHDPATRRDAAFVGAVLLVVAAGVVLMRKKESADPRKEETAETPDTERAETGAKEPALPGEETVELRVGVGRGPQGA
jgi:signal peptidase I